MRCGANRKGFNADAGRCTPMHADGTWTNAPVLLLFKIGRLESAVKAHVGRRPIRVHRRSSLLHLRKNSCLLCHLLPQGAAACERVFPPQHTRKGPATVACLPCTINCSANLSSRQLVPAL